MSTKSESQIGSQTAENQSVADEIFKTIIQLNKERIEFEKMNRFFDAGKVKDQLTLLGQEFIRVTLISLKDSQQTEKQSLEEEYERELKEINSTWDQRLNKNEEEIRQFLDETQERQKDELKKFEEDLVQSIPQQGRFSSEILNMEYQVQMLVRDQRYNEAGNLLKRLEIQKNTCLNKISDKTDEKIRNLLETMIKRHENELLVIEKRLNSDREELLKMREKDFETVHSKFKIFREKLETNHNADYIKEERRLKTFNASSNSLANYN